MLRGAGHFFGKKLSHLIGKKVLPINFDHGSFCLRDLLTLFANNFEIFRYRSKSFGQHVIMVNKYTVFKVDGSIKYYCYRRGTSSLDRTD